VNRIESLALLALGIAGPADDDPVLSCLDALSNDLETVWLSIASDCTEALRVASCLERLVVRSKAVRQLHASKAGAR
jgi:hypothetical protein